MKVVFFIFLFPFIIFAAPAKHDVYSSLLKNKDSGNAKAPGFTDLKGRSINSMQPSLRSANRGSFRLCHDFYFSTESGIALPITP